MPLTLHTLKKSNQLTICALGNGESIEVLDFLEEMQNKRPKEVAKLSALFDRAIGHGIPKDKQKCRTLGNKLYEFKTPGGLRIIWFWDEGRMVICTHGFKKSTQKTPRGQIEKALAKKSDYFEAKASGSLLREDK